MDGWINCDLIPGPNVDESFDAQKDWPFPDNAAGAIYASHLLEHLVDPLAFFREAWRVLQPNGQIVLRMPYGDHRAAWWDLTHIRPWYAETFCLLQPGYEAAVGNPQHAIWRWPFGATAEVRVSGKWAGLLRWRLARPLLLTFAENIQNFFEEMWVYGWALKRSEDISRYQIDHLANSIETYPVMYGHHLERRELRPGEQARLVRLGEDRAVNGFHSWR